MCYGFNFMLPLIEESNKEKVLLQSISSFTTYSYVIAGLLKHLMFLDFSSNNFFVERLF